MDLDIVFCFDKKSKRLLRISPMAKEVSVNEQKRKRETFTFTVYHGVDAWTEKGCLLVSSHSLGESR